MRPAGRLEDRTGRADGFIELLVPAIGVGLEDPAPPLKVALGMGAAAVARIIEHRCRRCGTAERSIVADIGPTSPGIGLALGQHRHGRVVAMQPLAGEDMSFDALDDRIQHKAGGTHLIGQGR